MTLSVWVLNKSGDWSLTIAPGNLFCHVIQVTFRTFFFFDIISPGSILEKISSAQFHFHKEINGNNNNNKKIRKERTWKMDYDKGILGRRGCNTDRAHARKEKEQSRARLDQKTGLAGENNSLSISTWTINEINGNSPTSFFLATSELKWASRCSFSYIWS